MSNPSHSPSSISPLWRQNPTASGSMKRQADRRHWRIFVLLACILALAGVLIGLLGWIRPLPRPYLFPIWVSSYQSRQISFLPWAEQDLHAMSRGDSISRIINTPFGNQDRRTIQQELGRLGELVATDSVVVYVNARACIGPRGAVALFPADADPADFRTWIPLREVLEALRASPAGWKLLVLDLTKPHGESRNAVIDDDIASRIPDDLKAVDDPCRLTLTAAAPGQYSLTSEELGRSIFSYYFEAGLRGGTELDRPRLQRDGLIRVTDLAAYVRSHVERWARLNRCVLQQPVLYGVGANFPLLALKHDIIEFAPPMPPSATYPGWLQAGWSVRDRWRAAANDQVAPLAYRQLEQTLLTAETEWRGGVDPARIRQDRMANLPIYEQLLAKVQRTAQPKPTSLAMATAQGWTQDQAVAAAVAELLAKPTAPAKAATPPAAKPVAATKPGTGDTAAALDAKIKGASMLDLAGALFDAARTAEPTRETILLLDGLLKDQQPEPLFVETLLLRQLAELAKSYEDATWPTETVRRALKVTSQGERANNQSETLAWLRLSLEEAALLRHNAEVILRAHGFAAVAEADRLFRVAEARYALILEQQRVVLDARHLWLEALQFLPQSLDDLNSPTIVQNHWIETVGRVIAIRDALTLPDEVIRNGTPLPIDEMRRRIEILHAQTEGLRQDLDELQRPYSDAALATLLAEARSPRAGSETIRAIQTVLRNPAPAAKKRVALWQAAHDLAGRLLKETLKLDRARLDPESIANSGQVASRASDNRRLVDRARRRIILLRLAGLPEAEAKVLDNRVAKAATRGEDPGAWWDLERGLREVWNGGSNESTQGPADSSNRARLNPLVAPSWSSAFNDATPKSIFYATWLREKRALWAWLADQYEYEGVDLGGSLFFRTAARELRTMSGKSERGRLVSPWGFPGPVATLSAESPITTESLSLRVPPGQAESGPTHIDLLLADPSWLRVVTASTVLRRSGPAGAAANGLASSYVLSPSTTAVRAIPLRAELAPEAEQPSDMPPPQGFLVRAHVDGRDYYQAVTIDLELASRRMQMFLSANPKEPTEPQLDLGLRAIKDRQPYYLYLRNPTSAAQDVLVDLKVGDQAVPGTAPRISVAPGAITRVPLPPGSMKSETPLPELTGPLQILLRNATDKESILGRATIGVRIAAPAEYVRVSHVEYAPASSTGGASKNRLSIALRTSAATAGPPTVAQLLLPPDQIPGFLGIGDGTLRGLLPPDGTPLLLFVKGLRRLPGADSVGTFYIQVDAYPRGIAFRTTFPPDGQPTLPVEDSRPALRLRAARSTPAVVSFPVRAEVDNPSPGSSLEIMLGRSQSGSFEPEEVRRFPTAQHRRIGFAPGGPDGSLLFEASADDWTTTLDLSEIEGQRVLRARLLDENGQEIQAVSQPLLIDNSRPNGPSLIELPLQARRGSKLMVKATASATDSGIASVRFFVGKPPAEGTPLPATVTTTPGNPDTEGVIWSAELNLPDVKGPTDLAAQFTTGAGQTSYATANIELTDTDPVTPGRIVGTVLEGPRPQPGMVVILSQKPKDEAQTKEAKPKAAQAKEAPNTEIARATTTADGTFRFDNLAPGNYQLTTSKEASQTKAKADVNVKASTTATVPLELFR
ncbi:Carboxypeptidase regulatory-like domain-containing protein [Singulisphaera sp. GP187]|uniref:carboxypeptidase-like regulatory domain-containing protein n=1 Tax=Singulisphaera sp. GP187 TaxID=1882752 RepID=UPI00092A7941|nr:carboxypeptidase-like regulatory domain-containing protein [Singulisphaera sp. GP187]SIO60646.1 Carboxypeptidase regulatory-like domain-containing protein [Singulisphaera sp. GP187]